MKAWQRIVVLGVVLVATTAAYAPQRNDGVPDDFGSVPVGTIVAYAGDLGAVPRNWLLCDGTSRKVSDYRDLARVIGSRWGGTAAADFNLPDLMGRFLRGVDSSAGRDPGPRGVSAIGGQSGNNVGSVEEDAFQDHTHALNRDHVNGSNNTKDVDGGNDHWNSDPGYGAISVLGANSGRTSSETRPRNAAVYWIIRAR